MARKSRFWGNFWGETGRNTGKWASNKIFGPTGWATPKRHIMHHEEGGRISGRSHRTSSFSSSGEDDSTSDLFFKEQSKNRQDLQNKVDAIRFDSNDVHVICANIDELLTGARLAQQNNMSEGVFIPKIRAGIMRLQRLSEHELAAFYRSELNQVLRVKWLGKLKHFLIMVAVFGGLIFFAFFYKG